MRCVWLRSNTFPLVLFWQELTTFSCVRCWMKRFINQILQLLINLAPYFSYSLWRRANARNASFQSLYGGQFTLSTQLINPKFCVSRPHRRSTTVSLETNPFACQYFSTVLHCANPGLPINWNSIVSIFHQTVHQSIVWQKTVGSIIVGRYSLSPATVGNILKQDSCPKNSSNLFSWRDALE